MRIAATLIAVLCLTYLAAAQEEAEPPHPLGCWAGLVGGEWYAEGAWETGTPFASRLVAEWGPKKSFMRLRDFIPLTGGEYLSSDSVYFWHPGKKQLARFSANQLGAVSNRTFEVGENTVTFVSSFSNPSLRFRSTWQFVTPDQCRWTAWRGPAAGSEEPWAKLIAVDYHRKKAPEKKLRPTRPPTLQHLAPLSRFVGGRFAVTGMLGNGTPVTGAIEHTWGVTHHVMISKTFVIQDDAETLGFVGFTWWDAEAKVFRMIEFSAYGVFSEGTITVDQDTFVLAFTTWSKAGAKQYRQWTVFETDDRITWYVEEKTETGWKKVTERMAGERPSE